MKEYRDEDVAKMLGWTIQPDQQIGGESNWHDTSGVKIMHLNQLHFGLDTLPSPEADASCARYVLPWMYTKFQRILIDFDGDGVWFGTLGCEPFTKDDYTDFTGNGDFGPTLCRACLDAAGESNG